MEQLIEMVLQALRAAGIHCVRALDEETLPRLKAPMVAVGADPSACRQHALARYLGQDADGAERYGMELQATLQLEVYSPGRRAGALCERAAAQVVDVFLGGIEGLYSGDLELGRTAKDGLLPLRRPRAADAAALYHGAGRCVHARGGEGGIAMIHERPGVWSAFGAQGTTVLTDRRLAAVIAPADAAEGVQLVHSAAEAVSLYGGNALLTRMLKLCLANCGDPVYAVAVDEDTKVAYETALTALFAAAKPGVLIVGSAREDVQLLLRETAEANECLGVAGMKGASADALVARAKALCCARIVLTGPDVLAQDEAVADGFCAAAAVGGAIASLSTPVVPLHDVALFGLQSLSALYTDDELDKLLQAGVTPVQLSGGRMCALRILTTRATAEGPEGESFRSLNATLVTDELLRDLRAALAARFRAAQNSTLTRTAIRSAVLLVLQDYRARGWLSAFGDLRVYADAGDASLCRVEFTYSIPAGLHRIALSAQMTG